MSGDELGTLQHKLRSASTPALVQAQRLYVRTENVTSLLFLVCLLLGIWQLDWRWFATGVLFLLGWGLSHAAEDCVVTELARRRWLESTCPDEVA